MMFRQECVCYSCMVFMSADHLKMFVCKRGQDDENACHDPTYSSFDNSHMS